MSESSDEDSCLSSAEIEEPNALGFLPKNKKSRVVYLKAYTLFEEWRESKGVNSYSEELILSYFEELSKTRRPSTIWSVYSMLKATLKFKQDVHLENYPKLVEYLKVASEGYIPKKSKVFTSENVLKFIKEAPDEDYLAIKVGLIIGVSGACRSRELLRLSVTHIEKHSEELMLINVPEMRGGRSKMKINRSFLIRGEYVKIVEKYRVLRPAKVKTDRFFLKYHKGKCIRQPMGINKFSALPRIVATFLNLPDPHLYTGRCFRNTSVTLLPDPGLRRRKNARMSDAADFDMEKSSIDSKWKISTRNQAITFKTLNDVWIADTENFTKSPSVSPLLSPAKEYFYESDNNSKESENSLDMHTVIIAGMSKKTALNDYPYRGLVEARSIPAELHVRADGRQYASFGSVVPIHCCTPDQVSERAATTHHFCDIFTEQVPAALSELAYVRLDENTAEKVFINRSKRILITSSDGQLAQWRAAPTFESTNDYLAGAPIVNKEGAFVSVVTARKGNHYAVSNFEGDGGYFATELPWTLLETPEGHLVYGDRTFATREELRDYIVSLPPLEVSPVAPPKPVLQFTKKGTEARLALVSRGGRQLSHAIIQHVTVAGVEYL